MDQGFAKIEGQLATVIAEMRAEREARMTGVTGMERRITRLEDDGEKLETRIRDIESRKTISPSQLWTAVTSGLVAFGGIISLVNFLASK